MFTQNNIHLIVEACRKFSKNVFRNKAVIPELKIEIVCSPKDFLGVQGNPAIFINDKTFKLLGKSHPEWEKNKTIAIRESFLQAHPIEIIGAIVHEVGHASNLAAHLPNTEANAYVFEIETLAYLINNNYPLLAQYGEKGIDNYFQSRLKNYELNADGRHHRYLGDLINAIKRHHIFDVLKKQHNNKSIINQYGIFSISERMIQNLCISIPKILSITYPR